MHTAMGGRDLTGWMRWLVISVIVGLTAATAAAAGETSDVLQHRLAARLGPRDAAIVAAPDGRVMAAVNADRQLIPASTLKLLTGLAAFHYLGETYHFSTDFYLTPDNDLVIKGYGDPLLVSERLEEIARQLATQIDRVADLILDDSFFAYPIRIPGRHRTAQPYDAPNGALCVNFNTVFFKRQKGRWVSAEPQTPLLPSVIGKIKASGLSSGRITLAGGRNGSLQYAGELFAYFLKRAGVAVEGQVVPGTADPSRDTLLWRYTSPQALTAVVRDLLAFSNNFIANQLMLTMGARIHGPPATVQKGLTVLQHFYGAVLDIKTGRIVEGSGLSRGNRVSAVTMLHILDRFEPYHRLMRQEGRQWYKTGTLNGVHTRVGYLKGTAGGLYRFVVLINTPGERTDRAMGLIEAQVR